MGITDRRLAIVAALLFLLAGMAGGKDHWNTPNGFLQHVVLLYLPCFAVWFGRRIENPFYAIGIPAGLGILLTAPSLLFFSKGNSGSLILVVALTVLLPAVISAVARLQKKLRPVPGADARFDRLRAAARRSLLFSIIGVVIFPQLVQPAILDISLSLGAAQKADDHDEQISGPLGVAKWIAMISLGIIALAGLFSLLMATMDAFL